MLSSCFQLQLILLLVAAAAAAGATFVGRLNGSRTGYIALPAWQPCSNASLQLDFSAPARGDAGLLIYSEMKDSQAAAAVGSSSPLFIYAWLVEDRLNLRFNIFRLPIAPLALVSLSIGESRHRYLRLRLTFERDFLLARLEGLDNCFFGMQGGSNATFLNLSQSAICETLDVQRTRLAGTGRARRVRESGRLFIGGLPPRLSGNAQSLDFYGAGLMPHFRGLIGNPVYTDCEGSNEVGLTSPGVLELGDGVQLNKNQQELSQCQRACLNGGVCLAQLGTGTGYCYCAAGYAGAACERLEHQTSTTFNGRGYVYLNVSSSLGLNGYSDSISLQYRTRQQTAFLIYVGTDRSIDATASPAPRDYIAVSLRNGSLALELSVGGVASSFLILPTAPDGSLLPQMFVDSRWHRLQISRRREKDSTSLKVEIKFDDRVLRSLTVRQGGALISKTIYLGGYLDHWMPRAVVQTNEFFKGCMREAMYKFEGARVDLLTFARDRLHGVQSTGLGGDAAFSGCVDPHVLEAVEFRRPDDGSFLTVRRRLPASATSTPAGGGVGDDGDSANTLVSLSFNFVTNEADALLLYLGSNRSDFLAFELRDNRLHVLVDFGAGVIARRFDAPLRRDALNHVAFVNTQQRRAVTLNDWLTLAMNDSDKLDQFHRLDLGDKIYLGGVPASKRFIIAPELHSVTLNQGFAGLISNLTVNGEGIDLVYELRQRSARTLSSLTADEANALVASESSAKRQGGECASLPCSNGGQCTDGWRRFKCDCSRTGFVGADCSRRAPTLQFDGTGWVRVSFAAPLRSFAEEVILRFRTNVSRDSLLFATVNRKYASRDTMRLELRDGVLVCTVDYGEKSFELRGDGYYLTDGRWHTVRISRREFNLEMSLDDKPRFSRSVNGTDKNFKQLETSEIGIGAPSGQYDDHHRSRQQEPPQRLRRLRQQNFFYGSMSHFSFNGIDYFDPGLRHQLDAASPTTVVEVTAREDDSPVEVLLPFTVRTPRAFAELPTLNLVDDFSLKLRFRTGQANGLLLLSAGGLSRSSDFLLLELLNGRLRLALNPGLTSAVTQRELPVEPGGRLDDNLWHLVELRRRQRHRLVYRVDGRPAGSAGFVGEIGDDGGFNVNVNKNSLYLGGAPRHLMEARRDVILSGVGFQGCLGSVHLCSNEESDKQGIYGEAASVCDVLDHRTNRNEFVEDLTPRCQRPKIECHSQMCYYGGQCLQQRDSVACLCDSTSFTGDWCNRVGSATFQFGRESRPGRLTFEFLDDTFLPTTKRDDIAFGFQTARDSGPLLRVDAKDKNSDFILISIVNRRIRVEYNMKSSTIALDSPEDVSDGRYHRVRFLREETRGSLYIDDHPALIKHPDPNVGTTFNSQKYIQVGRLATTPKAAMRRRRRSAAATDDIREHFQGYLVGLMFNGLPLSRIAAEEEAVADLARLHVEREGDVQQVRDFVPTLYGFPPKDRPDYYRNADLMPTTIKPSPTPMRCSPENRFHSDCNNDARGVNLPDYRAGFDDRLPTKKPPVSRGQPDLPSQPSQSSSSSSSSGGSRADSTGGAASAKPPVQPAKINLFVIVAVGAAGALLLLVFFCLIYRCRSRNEGSYRVDETQNFAADGIGGPGIQLDPALKPLRSDGSSTSSSRRHLNGDARGAGKSSSRKRDMKEWYV